MPSKPCTLCGETKAITEFYRNAGMSDGHVNQCKDCVCQRARVRYRTKMADPEWRAAERRRSREKWGRLGGTWRSEPARYQGAHYAVTNAVRDGRLTPSDNCEDCGHDFTEFRREGHHEDYSKPLDVTWLCSLCHGKRHRLYDAA